MVVNRHTPEDAFRQMYFLLGLVFGVILGVGVLLLWAVGSQWDEPFRKRDDEGKLKRRWL